MPHSTSERPRKKIKLDHATPQIVQCVPTDFLDICRALPTLDPDVLPKALSTLRSKLSFKLDQEISSNDDRLLSIKAWLETSPGLQDVFDVWERISQLSTLASLVTVLTSTLSLLSSHFSYHAYGVSIIKFLLSVHCVRRLNTYLSGSHKDLILATLSLFNAMSAFGGGRERKCVLEVFPWDNKTLSKFLRMRLRSKHGSNNVTLCKPDIRTLYVLFILSFVDRDTTSSVKTTFLQEHREVFVSIFKGLVQDPLPVVQRVLETCWEGLWADPKVSRSLKIAAFGEATISHLVTLYNCVAPEGEGSVTPADIVHHFLLAICSRPGHGVCFKDRGWYFRETEESFSVQEEKIEMTFHKTFMSGKVYNKILANVLSTLKVTDDLRQQELALKIFVACPELVAGYWPTAPLTLEPRLSSKWIANIAFAGQTISLAVPVSSFLLPDSTFYNPTPPPLSTIMANIFPAIGTKVYFTKGLQAGVAGLVQHCMAITLAKCLTKLAEVVRVFEMIAVVLEEDENNGQWIQRQKEVMKETRRRVPEFQAIVAFSQHYLSTQHPQNAVKHSLLGECSQRLLCLYQEYLPGIVAEAKFEVGKLVQTLAEGSLIAVPENIAASDTSHGRPPLQSMKQMHVLRLLCKSDQFTWSGKASPSRTFLGVLLTTFCNTDVRALRVTLLALLRRVLAESVLFQADPDEVDLWLAALPSGAARRWSGTESPDGAALTDEVDGVVAFIDDCAQRCLKTPHRYIQAMVDLRSVDAHSSDATQNDALFASPLLMTVLEQTAAKINGRLLTPSDTLAVFTFIRWLTIKLASKQEDPEYSSLRTSIRKIELITSDTDFYKDYPDIRGAVRRELSIVHACLDPRQVAEPDCSAGRQGNDAVIEAFLTRVEQIPVPENQSARNVRAYELVDWLRLVNATVTPSCVSRLGSVVRRYQKAALVPLIGFLHPSEGHLWESGLLDTIEESSMKPDFDWLFIHCHDTHLRDVGCRTKLLRALFSSRDNPSEVQRAVRLILHRIAVSNDRHGPMQNLLLLLSELFKIAKTTTTMTRKGIQHIGVAVLSQSPVFEGLCLSLTLAPEVHEALWKVIEVVFNWTNAEDRAMLTRTITHWADNLKEVLSSNKQRGLKCAKPWIKFLDTPDLFAALGLIDTVAEVQPSSTCELAEEILISLQQNDACLPITCLLRLQVLLPRSSHLEDMLASSLTSQLPLAYDGTAPSVSSTFGFSPLSMRVDGHLTSISRDLITQFLDKETWTDSTPKIIAALLYANMSTSPVFAKWLNATKWKGLSVDHLATTFAAFLDCLDPDADDLVLLEESVLCDILQQLITQWPDARESKLCRLRCICATLERHSRRRHHLSTILESKFQAFPITSFAMETMYIAHRTRHLIGCETLSDVLVDRALQWAIRHFSGECHDKDSQHTIIILGNLCKANFQLKIHLVESLVTVIIKNHLHDASAIEVAFNLVQATQLKPLFANRILQSIIQHQDFFKLLAEGADATEKNEITRLLDALFRLHPTSACQPSSIELVLQVYGGTMSLSDRRLLYIARLFETTRHHSISPFFCRWSPSPGISVTNILEVVQGLDPVKVLRGCLFFPSWRRLHVEEEVRQGPEDSNMYDPLFMIALCGQMLVEFPPNTALNWVKVFRTNILCLLIRSLSSDDPNMRETAACQLAMICKSLQSSAMQERAQVLYVLRLLQNVMRPSVDGVPVRLSTYVTLIVLHALRGIFYPSNFIYPRTACFLLQRPELDVGDVPMLFGMLYSSSDDWKKERGWIVKMLADGMVSAEDWQVLRRRHTWDLLASLFQNLGKDDTLRAGILGVLANLTCNPRACTSLVLKSAVLSWIEIQLMNGFEAEAIAWLRILENIIFVTDHSKLTRATGGEWLETMCRCLIYILQISGAMDIGGLYQVALVASRLSLVEKMHNDSIQLVLDRAMTCLKQLENDIQFCHPSSSEAVPESLLLAGPPHDASRLSNTLTINDPLQTWGKTVEKLWYITMILDRKPRVWETLTNRLLVWRGIAGEEASPIGEWARKETIRMLRTCV